MINETKLLRWTKDVPNKEGWYWHKTSKKTGGFPVEIVKIEYSEYWQWHAWSVGNDSHFLLDDCKDDFWAGPIQEPIITIIGSEAVIPDRDVNKYPKDGWRQFITTKIQKDVTDEKVEKYLREKEKNEKFMEEIFEIKKNHESRWMDYNLLKDFLSNRHIDKIKHSAGRSDGEVSLSFKHIEGDVFKLNANSYDFGTFAPVVRWAISKESCSKCEYWKEMYGGNGYCLLLEKDIKYFEICKDFKNKISFDIPIGVKIEGIEIVVT